MVVSHKQQQAAREAVRRNQGQDASVLSAAETLSPPDDAHTPPALSVQVVNADWVMVSADCKEALPMEWVSAVRCVYGTLHASSWLQLL